MSLLDTWVLDHPLPPLPHPKWALGISNLALPARAVNRFEKIGLWDAWQICAYGNQLRWMPGIGSKTFAEIRWAIAQVHMDTYWDHPEWCAWRD